MKSSGDESPTQGTQALRPAAQRSDGGRGEFWRPSDVRALVEALEKIANAPAWGAPDRWEVTPGEVRQLARSALSVLDRPRGSIEEYVENYEFRGDTDYRPSEREQELLIDALHDWEAEKATPVPSRETEGGDVEGLKPCPFCGSLAWLHVHGDALGPGVMGTRVECEGKCHAMTCYWHTSEQAVSAWNLRSAPEPWRPDREAVARIIDPVAAQHEEYDGPVTVRRWEAAFAKADLILDLPSKDMAWRPIESAPRDGTRILGYGTLHAEGCNVGETPRAEVAAYLDDVDGWYASAMGSWHPTHWQPLPAPPSKDTEG